MSVLTSISPSQTIPLENLFDPDFYRANNPDLQGLNNQQALQHWRSSGLAEGRSFSPLVDLNFYRASNPDLATLNNHQLLQHLADSGLNEGRAFSKLVALNFYRTSNPDLSNLNNRQLLEHLTIFGLNEGRSFYPFVDVNFYGDINPDLAGFNNRQLFNHLVGFGLNENRAFSPFVDLNYYRSSNPDLASLNNPQLFDHLIASGLNEGRIFSPFLEINFYRSSNPDLAGLNNQQLWEHFKNYGFAEGRRFSPIPFNSYSGYGQVNAAAAVAQAIGQNPFAEVPNTGSFLNGNLDQIKAPEVWNRGYTGQGIVVAVVDGGVDYYHPDLDNNIWVNSDEIPENGIDDDGNGYVDDVRGWDFVVKDNDPMDFDGHGTHVAGIIAAENNGIGVTGVAFNSKIMPVRVLDEFGVSLGIDYSDEIAAGIRYAADNGADVINLSLGSSSPNNAMSQAIRYAVGKGAVVVSAAGNDGGVQPVYPGRYATHFGITVGAVDRYNSIPVFSDYAGTTPLDYVVAPGVDIYSTYSFDRYELMDGTSMAAPHVAGVAALMLSANPNLSPVVVERMLTTTANSTIVRSFSASSIDSITGNKINSQNDDFNSQPLMQMATQRAMSGSTPDGFYDLTFGNDNFQIAPGLLAGSPLGLRALDGNDTVEGSSDGEVIFGNQGDDFLGGNGGNDSLWGGKERDILIGDDGNDILNGNMGEDVVYGGVGNDYIRGGKDGDFLIGEDGNDTLIGDLGTDALTGGAGSDVFVLRTDAISSDPDSVDFLLDFDRSIGSFFGDRIDLTGIFTEANVVLAQQDIPLSSIELNPGSFRQEVRSLTGVDVDPNGDGIISGTNIALTGGIVLGFAVNVTPADLSGRFF